MTSSRTDLSAADLGLVALAGVAGTGLRLAIGGAAPHGAGVPVAILGINVLGAFLLGWLLERLLRAPEIGERRSRRLRLGLGTGGLGGFTTYSALATDTVLVALEHPARAAAYALGTLVLGTLATVGGIALGRSGRPRPVCDVTGGAG